MLRICLVSAFALCAACFSSENTIVSPSEQRSLAEAHAKWVGRPFQDYHYEIERLCFCPPEINAWTRVTVRGGVVVAVEAVVPNPDAPTLNTAWWNPIDSLFTQIVNSTHSASVYADVRVTFDPTLGFPTEIKWIERPNVADAGMTYHVRNVGPVQSPEP